MKFYEIKTRTKGKAVEIYPDFPVVESYDLMTKGGGFYAVWDEKAGLWSKNEYDVARIVDTDLDIFAEKYKDDFGMTTVLHMRDFSSGSWLKYKTFLTKVPDRYHTLDSRVRFANSKVRKDDYVSFVLPYEMKEGDTPCYEELISTLYSPDERQKIEWAIGAVISGDSRKIQKFITLYGPQGTGKGTILEIIQKLFRVDDTERQRYYGTFKAQSLGSSTDQFSTSAFKDNSLIMIDGDGSLSRIEDNTTLNKIISHEAVMINEKGLKRYVIKPNAFIFIGTNEPVKISDQKSGIIRRLIDVQPTGNLIKSLDRYYELINGVDYELGAIAYHCLQVYKDAGGMSAYKDYKPKGMMYKTDPFYNFIDINYFKYAADDQVTLKTAYTDYKAYCESNAIKQLPMYKFADELSNYFECFERVTKIGGVQYRSLYSGFKRDKFDYDEPAIKDIPKESKKPKPKGKGWCVLTEQHSLLDDIFANCPAQEAVDRDGSKDIPKTSWIKNDLELKDIDTSKCHYVQPPLEYITIDFDIKDQNGNKSFELNLEAANKWPKTYAEVSKGGSGIHLEYIYEGDPLMIDPNYAEGIEVKVFKGNQALRRRVSLCNDIPVAKISSGLPLKKRKEEKMVNIVYAINEKNIRRGIRDNLMKKYHNSTRQSINFIEKILDDAYKSGIPYDVSDMYQEVYIFAAKSTNQSRECLKIVRNLHFKSDTPITSAPDETEGKRIVFFDIEIFPGSAKLGLPALFILCWKYEGAEEPVNTEINPDREKVAWIFEKNLAIGFNNRRYDNHICWAYAKDGYEIDELYYLSTRLIKDNSGYYAQAYNWSYADILDYSSVKQSLKKFEVALKILHKECAYRWDQPVPKEKWKEVADYCCNDVIATEAVHHSRKADFTARKILSDLSGLSVNDTTNSHSTRFIFGTNRTPQSEFNYRFMGDIPNEYTLFDTDNMVMLTTWTPEQERRYWHNMFDLQGRPIFPGYSFENGESRYRGELVGEGGYVYAEKGVHFDVALLDIESMHPSSLIAELLFGPNYTLRFGEMLRARKLIKHKRYDEAKKLLDGKLARYLDDPAQAKGLSGALKIVINSVYGLTSAKFKNPFKDPRNVDNIVAKRGALFMINLKHEVQARGFTVAHIKTDSIKIPNATKDIIDFVNRYGELYGYHFEHEATYERMCLVNDAVYIARYNEAGDLTDDGKHANTWTATGTQFQVPYVFKTLFSKEPIEFEDLCVTTSASTSLYLDKNENYPDVKLEEAKLSKIEKDIKKQLKDGIPESELEELQQKRKEILSEVDKGHNYIFVGKVGSFCPVVDGANGGWLVRDNENKNPFGSRYSSVSGGLNTRWLEAEEVMSLGKENYINTEYFDDMVTQAQMDIDEYASKIGMTFYDFVDLVTPKKKDIDIPPWDEPEKVPCGDNKIGACTECNKCDSEEYGCDAYRTKGA